MKKSVFIFVVLAMVLALSCGICAAEPWDGSVSTYLQPVDPTKDYDANTNPMAISSPADWAYLVQQSAIEPSGGKVTYRVNGEEKDPIWCSRLSYRQTADLVLNDETFTMDEDSGIIVVTDGTHTGYLGTGMSGYLYNTETPSSYGEWYTVDSLKGTLTVAEEGYTGELNQCYAIFRGPHRGINMKSFNGSFDGGHYSIRGFYVNNETTFLHNGLFGYIYMATIKNVNMIDCCLFSGRQEAAGAVVSYSWYGKLENCFASGIQINRGNNGKLGGLMGNGRGYADAIVKCGYIGYLGSAASNGGTISGIYNDEYDSKINCTDSYHIGNIAHVSKGGTYNGIGTCLGGATNCYSVGHEGMYSGSPLLSQITSSNKAVNCYYDKSFFSKTDVGTAVKRSELTAARLGLNWEDDKTGENYGYPVLKGQKGRAAEALSGFRLTPVKSLLLQKVRILPHQEYSYSFSAADCVEVKDESVLTYTCDKIYTGDGSTELTGASISKNEDNTFTLKVTATERNSFKAICPVKISDGIHEATVRVIYHFDVNRKPHITTESLEDSFEMVSGHTKYFSLPFKDEDGDKLTYECSISEDGGETFSEFVAAKSWYKPEKAGNHVLRYRAYDGYEYSDIFTYYVTVTQNHAPQLAGSARIKANTPTGCSWFYDVRTIFTDADKDQVRVSVSIDGAEPVSAGYSYFSFKRYQVGKHTLVFSGTDGIEPCSSTFTVELTVNKYGYTADVWNGAVDTGWYDEYVDVFTLNTPAQLAGLAAIVNGEAEDADGKKIKDNFDGRTIKLGSDICLNDASFSFDEASGMVKISKGANTFYYGLGCQGTDESVPLWREGSVCLDPRDSNSMPSSERMGDNWKCNDILLRGWTVIGSSNNSFKGTFDGQNHKITGLFFNQKYANGALFGQCDGVLKNVAVNNGMCTMGSNLSSLAYTFTGSLLENCSADVILNASSQVGGIVANINPTGNCTVKGLTYQGVALGRNVGGIASSISPKANKTVTVSDCVNNGMIVGKGIYGDAAAGVFDTVGCAKNAHVILSELVNTGSIGIFGTNPLSFGGGIVRSLAASSGDILLRDSYNTADLRFKNGVGGIVYGASTGTKNQFGDFRMESCYNTGALLVKSKKHENALFSGNFNYNGGNTYCKDVFYLTDPEAEATHVEIEGVASRTAEEMRSEEFLVELGEAFAKDSYGINNGYPILASQSSMANEKEITAFSIGSTVGTVEGKTVEFRDYAIAAEGDTLTFAPEIEVSAGAVVKPSSGEEVAFVQSKEDDSLYTAKYVVTAANGSKRGYTVNVYTKAAVSGLTLKETEISVVAGYLGKELVPIVAPANANNKAVSWSSEDESIAVVDEKGVVTGVKVGTATITATTEDGGKTAACAVTVTPYVSVASIALPETASVMKDESTTLTAAIAPENASDQNVVWSSEDESIAKVDENGVVTGISVGTVKITATTKDSSLESPLVAECSFSVTKIPVESVTLTQTKYVRVGGSKPISAALAPETATEQGLIWSGSDNTIATVDENGVVTGKAPGEVTITATAKDNEEIKGSVTLEICKEYPYDVSWNGAFNATESNNNSSDVPLPTDPEKIEEVWHVDAGNGSVAIVDDYVYTYAAAVGMNGFQIGGESKAFYKIDKETGEVVDMIHNCPGIGNYYYAYTIYGDGMLYVSAPSAVMAFDIDTFSLAWTASVGGGMYSAVQFVNGCVLANGRVLNAATGELIRDLEGDYNYSNGAVVGGKYYCIPSYQGTMYSFDTTTWKPVSSCAFKTMGTVLQPGAVYHKGRLYWGDAMTAYCYSVKIDSATGVIDKRSLIKRETNFTTTCTPVAYGDRIYLAGQGTGGGSVNVYDAETLELIYQAVGASQKIQSTPILYADKDSGTAYVYVQEYGGSAIYLLTDDGKQTSGKLEKLVTPTISAYAFEQLACDKDGALYCSNDSGNLFKFQTTTVKKPKLETDLSTERVIETLNSPAAPLSVKAVSVDGGTLSYQWQTRSVGGGWVDLEGQTGDTVVPDTTVEGKSYYRCIVTNTLEEKSTSVYSNEAQIMVVAAGKEQITVSFRLIGATRSTEAVNFDESPNDYKGSEYVTWHKTKHYTIENGATVGDLFKLACDEGDIRYEGWENDYIRTIYAPESCGGYELSEFTNGQYSGWMYTLNGKHAPKSMRTQDLADGDVVIWHYANDYRYEDESTNPDSPYLGQYLKAPDRNPGETETDEEIAKPVMDMIAALPENITLADGDAIAAARAAYDKLTKEQQGYVKNLDKLTAAEAAYAELMKVKENPFTDVKEGDYFFDAVLWAVENNVTKGTSATTFEPALACNRGQLVTFLWRAAGEPAPAATDCAFTDVKADAYYYKAVLWAVEKGITNGVSEAEFAPDAAVTRGQAVTFLYRYAGEPEVNGAMIFSDVADGEYYYDAVLWAVANKITNGMGDGTFAPGDVVTRGQAVTFLFRAR